MEALRVFTNIFPYLFYIGMFGALISNRLYHLGRWEEVLEKMTIIGMFGWLICVALYLGLGNIKKTNILEEVLESTNPFVIPKMGTKKHEESNPRAYD